VYPYSVIRGGAYSASELVRALDRDPVAAQHYAVFQRARVHAAESPFSEPVFLSYRIGNAIYWTSRPVRLPHGETLLTDGKHYARARCGNRISATSQTPVNDTEPAPSTLDQAKPPADVPLPGLESWAETRLVTELSPPFALVVPASAPSSNAVPGPGLTSNGGNVPAWWLIGAPSGFLYTWDVAAKLSPSLPPPSTGPPGVVIQPNPIPGLALPPLPGSVYPFEGGPPVGSAPFPTLPGWPTIPGSVPPWLPPSEWPPVSPGNPGVPITYPIPGGGGPPTLPIVPGGAIPEVPEPGLLPPTALALLAALVAARRGKRSNPALRP
jgi:hypothetical protein